MKLNIKNRLQFLLLLTITLLLSVHAEAQSDPSVSSAAVAVAPTSFGATGNSISFQFSNASPSVTLGLFPPTTLTLQLSKMNVFGAFSPSNITGAGSSFFTWTYNPTINMITGSLNSSVPPLAGGLINITGLIVSDSALISSPQIGFNVNVNATGSNNTTTANDFTSFYTYTVAMPLPVEWLSFDAKRYGQNAHLVWSTAKEENVSHFTPQFSLNGVDFVDLADVNPKNGASRNDYIHIHDITNYILNAKAQPILFYRVKQYDLNQQFTVTAVKKINLSAVSDGGFAVNYFPNPTTDFLNVSVDGIDLEDAVFYKLLDLQGRIVFELKNVTHIETDNIVIPVSSIARGSYMLKVNNGESSFAEKVILK